MSASSSWQVTLGLGVLLAATTFLPARSPGDAPSAINGGISPRSNVRVGLVFDVGGRGDKSYNDSAYAGIDRAIRELGVSVSFLEPSGAEDREAALRMFAAEGLDLVIGVGFIFSNDVNLVAEAYPNVKFGCVDYGVHGKPIPNNVRGLVFREEEGSYLVGAVAGLTTKTKHLGFVGGMTIPLIRKFEAGYRAGVRSVCATCVVHAGYAGSSPDAFKDPEKGKTITLSQVGLKADVVFHAAGSTGHGVFEAARESSIWSIGVDSDQYDEMPNVMLTSMVKRVDTAVFETIRDVLEHRFTSGMRAYGLADRGIDYVHEGVHARHLSQEIITRVEELREQVIAGKIQVPTDPASL